VGWHLDDTGQLCFSIVQIFCISSPFQANVIVDTWQWRIRTREHFVGNMSSKISSDLFFRLGISRPKPPTRYNFIPPSTLVHQYNHDKIPPLYRSPRRQRKADCRRHSYSLESLFLNHQPCFLPSSRAFRPAVQDAQSSRSTYHQTRSWKRSSV
jgi:hypothetical protein